MLVERFKLVVPDQRGAGRGSHSPIDYSVEQMAGDLFQLIDGLLAPAGASPTRR